MPFTSLGTLVCQRVNGQHWLKVGAGVSLISGISVIPVHPRAKRQSVSLTLILFPPHPNTQRAHTSQTKLHDTETRTTAGRIPPRGASSSTFIYWPQGIQCMWKTPEYSNPPHRPHVIAAPLWKKTHLAPLLAAGMATEQVGEIYTLCFFLLNHLQNFFKCNTLGIFFLLGPQQCSVQSRNKREEGKWKTSPCLKSVAPSS